MGRFATNLAAYAANVDNLPPKENLPDVSFWEAVLPGSVSDLFSESKKQEKKVGRPSPLRIHFVLCEGDVAVLNSRADSFSNTKQEKKDSPPESPPTSPPLPLPAMGKFFNWPPFVAVPIDANTGKPLDPNVGMRVQREFYNVGKDGKGKKVMVAHKSGSSAAAAAAGDGKKEDGGKGKGKDGGEKKGDVAGAGGGGEKKAADAPFTDDEDATLKRMKDEKKSWNEIIEVLGRNKKVLQDRFKELNGGGGGGNDTKKDEKKDNGKKDGDGEGKKDKPDTKKENKKQDKKPEAAKPAYAKAGSAAGSNDQARFTMNEWMTLQEDDVFSFAELQCLSELMLRDERHRWMRLASAFYDKTGRRVHPDDIREKFGEMGGLK